MSIWKDDRNQNYEIVGIFTFITFFDLWNFPNMKTGELV